MTVEPAYGETSENIYIIERFNLGHGVLLSSSEGHKESCLFLEKKVLSVS